VYKKYKAYDPNVDSDLLTKKDLKDSSSILMTLDFVLWVDLITTITVSTVWRPGLRILVHYMGQCDDHVACVNQKWAGSGGDDVDSNSQRG
jgi:hypothetical protein